MQIWAHRGASAVAPENTMAAFRKAHELGADAVELDVHRTADGVLVVIHDETVTRTTQGRGYVQAASFSWLQSLDAGYKFAPQFRGEYVPALQEVLEFVRETDMLINIELKTNQISYSGVEEQVVQMVEEMEMAERVVISSFNYDSLRRVLALTTSIPVAMLCSEFRPIRPADARRFGAQAIHPSVRTVNPSFMEEAIRMGIAIRPYTVDEPKIMQMLRAWGAQAVITNHPGVAKQVLHV